MRSDHGAQNRDSDGDHTTRQDCERDEWQDCKCWDCHDAKEGIEHTRFEHLRDVERKLMNMIMSGEMAKLPLKTTELLSPPPVDEDGNLRAPESRS